MMQPASIDVRLDRYFRLFDNHKYPYIDPREDQPELTRLIETKPDEPFILHPGEFVLGSTYEQVTLPDDVAARLEGKSSLGRLGLLTHSTAGFIDPGFLGTRDSGTVEHGDFADSAVAGVKGRPTVLLPPQLAH
jgi:dCTP deaminase